MALVWLSTPRNHTFRSHRMAWSWRANGWALITESILDRRSGYAPASDAHHWVPHRSGRLGHCPQLRPHVGRHCCKKRCHQCWRTTTPPRRLHRSDLSQPRWWPWSGKRVSRGRRRLEAAPFLRGMNDRYYLAGKSPGWSPGFPALRVSPMLGENFKVHVRKFGQSLRPNLIKIVYFMEAPVALLS